jgi:hypothetical protein
VFRLDRNARVLYRKPNRFFNFQVGTPELYTSLVSSLRSSLRFANLFQNVQGPIETIYTEIGFLHITNMLVNVRRAVHVISDECLRREENRRELTLFHDQKRMAAISAMKQTPHFCVFSPHPPDPDPTMRMVHPLVKRPNL